MNKRVTFLTEKSIDKNLLSRVIKEHSKKSIKPEDKSILDELILAMENNHLILSPQEIQFLNSNQQSTWSDYLIFRFKSEFI